MRFFSFLAQQTNFISKKQTLKSNFNEFANPPRSSFLQNKKLVKPALIPHSDKRSTRHLRLP